MDGSDDCGTKSSYGARYFSGTYPLYVWVRDMISHITSPNEYISDQIKFVKSSETNESDNSSGDMYRFVPTKYLSDVVSETVNVKL